MANGFQEGLGSIADAFTKMMDGVSLSGSIHGMQDVAEGELCTFAGPSFGGARGEGRMAVPESLSI